MILFINDLTVIDSSYLCTNRGMVGESWIVDLEIEGDLNAMNMVFDFARVKQQTKRLIDDVVDHKLLLPQQSDAMLLSQLGETCYVDFQYNHTKSLHLSAPLSAFALIPNISISERAIINFITDQLMAVLPNNIEDIRLSLRNEVIDGAFYHYSHGLKKHDGNCQRIAHGHRSKIKIYENNKRNHALEEAWSQRWSDIYLGSQSDVTTLQKMNLSDTAKRSINNHHLFAYKAIQGDFSLAIPSDTTEIVPCDTTVECLALFIAQTLKKQSPSSKFKVIAYEGVQKGAIATA